MLVTSFLDKPRDKPRLLVWFPSRPGLQAFGVPSHKELKHQLFVDENGHPRQGAICPSPSLFQGV